MRYPAGFHFETNTEIALLKVSPLSTLTPKRFCVNQKDRYVKKRISMKNYEILKSF